MGLSDSIGSLNRTHFAEWLKRLVHGGGCVSLLLALVVVAAQAITPAAMAEPGTSGSGGQGGLPVGTILLQDAIAETWFKLTGEVWDVEENWVIVTQGDVRDNGSFLGMTQNDVPIVFTVEEYGEIPMDPQYLTPEQILQVATEGISMWTAAAYVQGPASDLVAHVHAIHREITDTTELYVLYQMSIGWTPYGLDDGDGLEGDVCAQYADAVAACHQSHNQAISSLMNNFQIQLGNIDAALQSALNLADQNRMAAYAAAQAMRDGADAQYDQAVAAAQMIYDASVSQALADYAGTMALCAVAKVGGYLFGPIGIIVGTATFIACTTTATVLLESALDTAQAIYDASVALAELTRQGTCAAADALIEAAESAYDTAVESTWNQYDAALCGLVCSVGSQRVAARQILEMCLASAYGNYGQHCVWIDIPDDGDDPGLGEELPTDPFGCECAW